jgi:hypothetical protein
MVFSFICCPCLQLLELEGLLCFAHEADLKQLVQDVSELERDDTVWIAG